MSIEAASQFWDAVSANEEWQGEIRNFTVEDNLVNYAKGKGYAFSDAAWQQYWIENKYGELSEFETEMVAGGGFWTAMFMAYPSLVVSTHSAFRFRANGLPYRG